MATLSIDPHVAGRPTEAGAATHRLDPPHAPHRRRSGIPAFLQLALRASRHFWRNRRYYTLRKLLNIGLIELQYRFKREHVYGRPYAVKIESTNLCNTQCQLCPTGLLLPGRRKGTMDFEQFRGLVDRFKPWTREIDLAMWGDPLIVRDIYRMIRYAHDARIWTSVSSNLHAFRPELGHAQAMIESGLDELLCSLHGATQATFEKYQPRKQLAPLLERIRMLQDQKQTMRSRTPIVRLHFVVTRANEHEMAAFRDLADGLGCTAIFSNPSLNIRFAELQRKGRQSRDQATSAGHSDARAVMERWLPQNEAFVDEVYRRVRAGAHFNGDFNGRKLVNCDWPWRRAVINWDGSVVPCCGSWHKNEELGNVFQQSWREIWNGRAYRMARRSFRHRVEAPQGYNNPCRNCPGIMP